MIKTLKIGKLHRAVSKEDLKLNRETRTIRISFSSEAPIERWFGTEILSHAPGACDLVRFKNKAIALFNHNWDKYVGVIEDAEIDSNAKRGYCDVRFAEHDLAEQVMNDVEKGIITGVSFGYQILELVLSKQNDGEPNEYTATKWQPYEVSFVTVPADISVGVGRAENEKDTLEVPITNQRSIEPKRGVTMPPENMPQPAPAQPTVDVKAIRAEAVKAERERTEGIRALGEKFKKPELARQLIDGDRSIDEARAAFLEALGMVQKPISETDGNIGMSEREIKQFSFVRAVRAMMDPNNRAFQEEAGFEREVSLAAQKESKRDAKGFLIPFDILRTAIGQDPRMLRRDQTVGSSTAGGNLVATNLLASSFIDLLRNKSILQQAGAMTLAGLVGNIAIPRKTTASNVYWVGEGNAPTEGAIAFDQVAMSPKTVGAFIDYSRKLMLQSTPDIETLIRADLADGIALELDRVGLYGSGSSNQPLGLKDTSGVNTKDFAADAPTWAEIVDLETKVMTANADIGSMKYITNAVGNGNLKTTAKASNQAIFLTEDGKTNGYDQLVSNQIASGDHWFGVWNQLMFGLWSGLDLLVDPYTGSTSGNVRVVAHQDADIGARQPTAFTRGNNTL